ncbi:MAG: sigma 54-interacting transcriptional regulator, partial [Pseudomonadota bacterium]
MRRVLVLEASDTLRGDLLLGLRRHGIEADGLAATSEVAAALAAGGAGVVILGPDAIDVGDLLTAVTAAASRSSSPPPPVEVVVVVVDGDTAKGLAAVRQGASDFVALADGAAGLAVALGKIEARRVSAPRVRAGSNGQAPGPAAPAAAVLVGSDPKITAVLEMVRRLAGVRAGILVGGESGTGKELVARALHDQSPWHR